DHSESPSESVHLMDANHLLLGDIDLHRAKPKQPSLPATLNYFKAMEAGTPYLQVLDDKTNYLRLPSFNLGYKAAIDDLMVENKNAILNKPYLIIDLRNNGGGSDDSYLEILPFLYTSPIKVVGVSFLASPLNISSLEEGSKNPKLDEETRETLAELIPKLKANEGSFVNLEEEEISYIEMDEIYPQPQKIAILINEGNASSAEQFLLEARQSSKVQLFGRNTAGILDISNVNIVTSPGGEFVLFYSMSRSHRIPDQAIDDIGITPDVVIPDEIPDHQWIEFVKQRMQEQ
ncbi:MAG: S41 family peptidase, partial [Bacteroidia bacterium]|nr:S41 family peptidase [Bacteroidia bacterium]